MLVFQRLGGGVAPQFAPHFRMQAFGEGFGQGLEHSDRLPARTGPKESPSANCRALSKHPFAGFLYRSIHRVGRQVYVARPGDDSIFDIRLLKNQRVF